MDSNETPSIPSYSVEINSSGEVVWSGELSASISGGSASIVSSSPQYPPPLPTTTASATYGNLFGNTTAPAICAECKTLRAFRELDPDEKKRLIHALNGDRIHIRVNKPSLTDDEMPNYKLGIEVSDTDDFLVYVNLVDSEAITMGDMFDIENMANMLCTMLTLSGSEVIKDGKLFSPPTQS